MKHFNPVPRARHPRSRHSARIRSSHEAGFSLVEAAVALVLVAVLFVGLSMVMGVSLRNLRETRTQQQATALALEGVEFIRSLTWGELAMEPAPDTSDPLVLAGPPLMLDGSQVDVPQDEDIVADTTGLVAPLATVTLDGQVFEVAQFITQAEDAVGNPQTGLRRAVVAVRWTIAGKDHAHFTSTLISEVR